MSDLAFVCVSADLGLAEALADIFESAGHTVGDEPENSRAVIVVLSGDARHSRAFIEMAGQATDSGKAIVVTRLPIHAEHIDGAPVFDLSDWDGDPSSSAIDAVFSAVDLKLVAANFDERGAEPPLPKFAPPHVHVRPAGWKRGASWFGNTARALAFIAILATGAFGAGVVLSHHTPAVAHVSSIPADPMRVAFADSVLNDASFDDIAPPAPEPLGVRGREPPSAASLR